MDPRVLRVIDAQKKVLQSLGCQVEDACPDFTGATEAFETIRAVSFAMKYGPLLKTHRKQLKDTVIWNIEQGLAVTRRTVRPRRRAAHPAFPAVARLPRESTNSSSAR